MKTPADDAAAPFANQAMPDDAIAAGEEARPDRLAKGDELIGGSWIRNKDGSLVRSKED